SQVLQNGELDPSAQERLQLHGQVDGVDAVEIQVVTKQRLGRHVRWIDVEHLVQGGLQLGEDLVAGHGQLHWLVQGPEHSGVNSLSRLIASKEFVSLKVEE